MLNTELVKTLRIFNHKQQEDFLYFLASPYWTNGKQEERILRMCAYIIEHQDDEAALEEVKIYKYLYPELSTNTGHDLSNRRSEAMYYVKEFIVFDGIKNSSSAVFKQAKVANFYARNHLLHFAEREFSKVSKWQEASRIEWSHDDFFTALTATMDRTYYLSISNKQKDDVGLVDLLGELHHFFLHFKLHYGAILLGTNNITQVITPKIFTFLEVDVEKESYESYIQSQHGQLKATAFQLLQPNAAIGLKDYEDFKKKLLELSNVLYQPDFLNYWTILRHLALVNPHLFEHGSLSEFFELQKQEYQKEFKFRPKTINASNLYSCCYHAVRVGDWAWGKDFFEEYIEKLDSVELKEETTAFCKAIIAYGAGEPETALEHLSLVQFSDNQLKFMYRVVELKILYETDSELLESRIDSSIRYFRRDKTTSKSTKESLVAFGNILVRMKRADYGFKRSYTKKVLEEVNAIEKIAEKDWLLKTIEKDLKKCVE